MQPGMNFYGDMPDMYSVVINTEQPAVKKILADAEAALKDKVEPLRAAIDSDNAQITDLRKKKGEEKDEAKKKELDDEMNKLEGTVGEARAKEENEIKAYAAGVPNIKQIIDLALLQSNLLKGETLAAFIRRSVTLL